MENEVLKPEMEDFDLHETLRNTLLSWAKNLQKKIKMTLIIEDEDILVHADYNQIQRALTNLIDNALKFVKPVMKSLSRLPWLAIRFVSLWKIPVPESLKMI